MNDSALKTKKLYAIAAFAMAVIILAPFIGIETISPMDIAANSYEGDIFWRLRVPRALIAFLAGAGLAISGMAFQAMFRNPLATPFTLGVSAGASFGAAVYVTLGFAFSFAGISGVSVFAFLGAVMAITIVYGLTKVRKGFSTATMLLAGVAVSFFFTSVILFMQYISDFTRSFRVMRWLMGGLEVVGYDSVLNLFPFVMIGVGVVFLFTRELNLLTTGEEIAISRGVEARKVKAAMFFASSLMVGGVVAVCGPIGFVGMMTPHICRLMIGPDHRFLAPASALFGGVFLTLCDTLARTAIAPAEIPVGVITALLGGPFFLWLLLVGSSEKGLV